MQQEESNTKVIGIQKDDESNSRVDSNQSNSRSLLQSFHFQAAVPVLMLVVAAAGPIACMKWSVHTLWSVFRTVLGVALGIALGLGWALHVYEQLQTWKIRQEEAVGSGSGAAAFPPPPGRQVTRSISTMIVNSSSNALEDEQTYSALMQSAGYNVSDPKLLLRGQVLPRESDFLKTNYEFDRSNRATTVIRDLWPTLPGAIHESLGTFVDLLMRDFVSSWYSSIDGSCKYVEERERRKQETQQSNEGSSLSPRIMLYTLGQYRRVPFLDKLYESMAVVFGNLATRVEHVNVFELILLKWTKVLAHTFKAYRALRKSFLLKQMVHDGRKKAPTASFRRRASETLTHEQQAQQNIVSEIAMTKEFLFAGKLHRAVTFGLDVPSLLFADASGKECGTDLDAEDKILAHRLFETGLLQECELDYNRVVASRIVRALVLRADYGSQLVASLMTEILAGCVLTPMMGCFGPDYINGWIIKGLGSSDLSVDLGGEGEGETPALKPETSPSNEEEQGSSSALMRTWSTEEGEIQANSRSEVDVRAEAAEATDLPVELTVSLVERWDTAANKDFVSDGMVEEPPKVQPLDADSFPVVDGVSDGSQAPQLTRARPPSPAESLVSIPEESGKTQGDDIITMLALALIELQRFVDFEECRDARESNLEVNINWDDPGCRQAVLQLVLVIESALTNGRCTYRTKESSTDDISEVGSDVDELDDSERPVEVTLPEYESTTLSQILMEMTSDIEAFEERVATENALLANSKRIEFDDELAEDYTPTATEQSTLRTLIAAWLHTGQIYRTVSVLIQAHATILAPYYHSKAFLRSSSNAHGFVRQLRALDDINVLVDTMTVLASPRLDETTKDQLSALVQRSTVRGIQKVTEEDHSHEEPSTPTALISAQLGGNPAVPRYLDFHRNESFAASLRSERERRMSSWTETIYNDNSEHVEEGTPVVVRSKGVTEEDIAIHKELHHLARIFYSGTNLLVIRDAARRKNSHESISQSEFESDAEVSQVSLLTVETACPRRRIEVPDDDSSFLLRAQPRSLNAVGVHRDQRNHDQSFKCYAGTYEEPALPTGTDHFAGGRYIRRCLVRYYPIDRTASVALLNDSRRMDQRKARGTVPDTIVVSQSAARPTPFLSADFLRDRHLCQRWIPKGTTRTQSILSSAVMEPSDFTAVPRAGKAIDFVYRMALFERPMIDLSGKHFTVNDSGSMGPHRADASSLELSDAALSTALLLQSVSVGEQEGAVGGVEMGKDGYPVLWMKFSRKQDDTAVEVKPYRISFVRAALMVTAARQEAQLQCLLKCVKAGSAKKATKALTDAKLKPVIRLLEFAGNRSREKQHLVLRDLKLGVNHIDREQLRRNGLLSPRFPTSIIDFSATVEDALLPSEVPGIDLSGAGGASVFKIKCIATVLLTASDEELLHDVSYRDETGILGSVFREEWVVYRSFKDFQALHKHLKAQVSASESSGSAGSRLVGAAAAAFAGGGAAHGKQRQRKLLVPSLSQASKAGALGVTKKSILKRKEILNGYLSYLLSPGHLLGRCAELMLFLGAYFPLLPDIGPSPSETKIVDPLGRTEMLRVVVKLRKAPVRLELPEEIPEHLNEEMSPSPPGRSARAVSTGSMVSVENDELIEDDIGEDWDERGSRRSNKVDMIPAIRNKIDKVPLPQVRNRIFELLRYQFGFDNASFIRNRMLAALKTASFAITSAGDFRRTLYKLHTEYLNSDSVAGWITYGCEMLWPDGIYFQSSPPLSAEELENQSAHAKEVLHASFPDQVRTILGQELTHDGLNIFHEMLQNRIVVKSMAYMLFDLLWLEVFPEIGDVLNCSAALDVDS